jgi:nucleoside-diphosphate-sugar epimerase
MHHSHQYIYGPKSNKNDYIDWYFDRLVRELPLPIPGDGTQKVSLTNSEDVASILASPLNDEAAAVEQRFFNCGTDALVSYDEVAHLCAEAAGISEVMIDFYVAPNMAKSKLGWEGPKHSLKDDLSWYYESYVARGGPTKKIDLGKDWEITVGSKSSFELGSVYDKYDPVIIDTSEVQPLGESLK